MLAICYATSQTTLILSPENDEQGKNRGLMMLKRRALPEHF